MNLPVPIAGVDPGPDYALNINNALTLIDTHDHSSGKGVPVTPAGLNINSNLPFNNNNLITVRSIRWQVQGAAISGASDIGCCYVVGVDLYYNDVSGNQVRITQGGSVAGSTGSISGLSSPASASYVSGSSTFVWQSGVSTPANLDAASVILRNLSASSNGLTLSAPTSLASNYSITLPTLPSAQSFVTLDNSGNMAAPIATAQGITRANLAAVGQQISSSSGGFSTTSNFPTQVTNLTVTMTTTGRPVMIVMQPDGTNNSMNVGVETTSSSNLRGFLEVDRDASNIGIWLMQAQNGPANIGINNGHQIVILDVGASAGSHTWTVSAAVDSGGTAFVNNAVLVAYEL